MAGSARIPSTAIPVPSTMNFPLGAMTDYGVQAMLAAFHLQPFTLAASGSVDPSKQALYMITTSTVINVTLAAPVIDTDDFLEIEFFSTQPRAHTFTITGLNCGNNAPTSKVTFAAFAGCQFRVMAYQGKWYMRHNMGASFS